MKPPLVEVGVANVGTWAGLFGAVVVVAGIVVLGAVVGSAGTTMLGAGAVVLGTVVVVLVAGTVVEADGTASGTVVAGGQGNIAADGAGVCHARRLAPNTIGMPNPNIRLSMRRAPRLINTPASAITNAIRRTPATCDPVCGRVGDTQTGEKGPGIGVVDEADARTFLGDASCSAATTMVPTSTNRGLTGLTVHKMRHTVTFLPGACRRSKPPP